MKYLTSVDCLEFYNYNSSMHQRVTNFDNFIWLSDIQMTEGQKSLSPQNTKYSDRVINYAAKALIKQKSTVDVKFLIFS